MVLQCAARCSEERRREERELEIDDVSSKSDGRQSRLRRRHLSLPWLSFSLSPLYSSPPPSSASSLSGAILTSASSPNWIAWSMWASTAATPAPSSTPGV